MKIDRLMAIIVIMLNRDTITAKELAEKFEVSIRTIYRDIDTIDMAGIPIISYPGNNGGYGIMENYKLNNQLLTVNNLFSLLTTLRGINNTLNDIELDTSIEKLRTLIPNNKSHHLDLQLEQLIIDMPPWANTSEQNKMVKELRTSISESSLITIKYKNIKNSVSTRQIEAMAIIFKGYTWHLFAYCRLRNDYRIFKISRILNMQIEKETFTRKKKSYFEIEENSRNQDTFTCITMKFTKEIRARVEDIFKKEEIHYLKSGDMIVTAKFPDKEWYLSLILSFGDQVEVLSPDDIRQTLAMKAKAMSEKYN